MVIDETRTTLTEKDKEQDKRKEREKDQFKLIAFRKRQDTIG